MKQTFIVAFKVETDSDELPPFTVEEVVAQVKQMIGRAYNETTDHIVGELKKHVGWNKNVDVLFQLWLEERCKEMWP